MSMNPQFMAIIKKAEEEFKASKVLTLEEMKREVLDDEEEGPAN